MSRGLFAARWVTGCALTAFDATGGPVYPLGDVAANYWIALADKYTALRFVVIVDSDGPSTATPEASYDGAAIEAGPEAPVAFTVQNGFAYGDPYGIDEMRPFWRLALSGGKGRAGILGIPRGV